MIFPMLVLILMAGILWLGINRENNKANHPPGIPFPTAFAFLWGLCHPNVGDFIQKIGNMYGPVLYGSFGPLKILLVNGPDAVKEACRQPSLNGRLDCMYKEIIGSKGILWADESSQKRKFIFRNTRHFELGGKSAEGNIHDEITQLFKHYDTFNGSAFSVKHTFNIPTLNGVFHRLLGEKVPQSDQELNDLVRRLNVMSEAPGMMMRLCVFAPSLTKWVPSFLSRRNFVKSVVSEGLEYLRPYLERHLESRLPQQPRDLIDALMDEVEETNDAGSVFHASRNPIGPILFDMLCAATETTGALLEWIVLYLSHYPEVQRELQVELDSVIGHKRLPELSDRAQMPYLQAFLQEMYRIAPVVPFGPHMAVEDTVFRGYRIPKGTAIISNFYGIHMDSSFWENPKQLKPERFMDADGKFIKCDQIFLFGFGKRSCVGEVTARDQLFLYVSRLTQSYNLVPQKKLRSFDGNFGMGYHCPDFKTAFNPREI